MADKPKKRAGGAADAPVRDLETVLAGLRAAASEQFRIDQEKRYGIVTKDERYGTPMASIKAVAKALGRDHAFAEALWRTRVYEARMLASMVAEPDKLTAAQMDRWVEDCDNWAVVDTLCFNLFDRSPHAFGRIAKWSKAKDEFVKRAAFALLACMAVHGRGEDDNFVAALPLVEQGATDSRNFVKKAVSWALRAIGTRAGPKAGAAARALAETLAKSDDAAARWVGKDAVRELAKLTSRSARTTRPGRRNSRAPDA